MPCIYKYVNESVVNEQKMPQQGINAFIRKGAEIFKNLVDLKIITLVR